MNRYVEHSKRKQLLHGIASDHAAKGNVGKSSVEALKMVGLVLVGGGVGYVLAKSNKVLATVIGAAAAGAGFYFNNNPAKYIGMGMLTAPVARIVTGVNGPELPAEGIDGVKESLIEYKDSLLERFGLDKLFKKKATTSTASAPAPAATPTVKTGTNGFGEVQFFSYPDEVNGDLEDLEGNEPYYANESIYGDDSVQGPDDIQGSEDMGETDGLDALDELGERYENAALEYHSQMLGDEVNMGEAENFQGDEVGDPEVGYLKDSFGYLKDSVGYLEDSLAGDDLNDISDKLY